MNKKKKKNILLLLILLLLIAVGTIHPHAFKFAINYSNPSIIISSLNNLKNKINKALSSTLNINDKKEELILNSSENNIGESSIITSYSNNFIVKSKKATLSNNINIENTRDTKNNESLLISTSEIVVQNIKKANNIINKQNNNSNIDSFNNNTSEGSSLEQNDKVELINNSIYCWHDYIISSNYIDIIINRLKSLNITNAYISMGDIESHKDEISKLKENGISVYYLDGHSSWYTDVDSIKDKIDKVDEYNKNNPNIELSGIVLDIEPYSRSEYKADVISGFETYVNTMEQAYSYATSKNVKMSITIPYWFDKYMTENKYTDLERERAAIAFDKLIKNSDRINVMNYYKSNMASHLETELNYAKKYGKEIESIAEFSKPNSEIPSKTTFYSDNDPINTAITEWQKIKSTFNYDKLTFSYHHLDMILEINKEINRYTFEFIDDNSNVVSSGKYFVTLPSGEKIEKSVTSDVYVAPNINFNVSLNDYDISSYEGETILSNGTIKRTYHVIPKEKYQLEVYANYLDNSKVSNGKIKLINTNTLEELTADYNETNGYFFFRKIYSDVSYKVVYIDSAGNEYSLESATAKNNESVQTTISSNDNIIIPKGFKSSLYISPKLIIKKEIEVPPESYFLELYPKLWNGTRYSSIKEGQVKLVNVSTNEEETYTILGDSHAGYYVYFTVSANTDYRLCILDSAGNDLGYSVVSYKYKDANNETHKVNSQNGIFNLPAGLNSPLYPTFNFE